MGKLRRLARLMLVRVERTAQADPNLAVQQGIDVIRLGMAGQREAKYNIGYLVLLAIEGMGCYSVTDVVNRHDCDEEVLMKALETTGAIDDKLDEMVNAMIEDYYFTKNQDLFDFREIFGTDEKVEIPWYYRRFYKKGDTMIRLSRMLVDYFKAVRAQPWCLEPPTKGKYSDGSLLDGYLSGNFVGIIGLPERFDSILDMNKMRVMSVAKDRMLRISLALKILHQRHGRLPDSLDETKGILGEVPIDPITGKSFIYKPKQALLYSVGFDGNDDGGSDIDEDGIYTDRDYPLKLEFADLKE